MTKRYFVKMDENVFSELISTHRKALKGTKRIDDDLSGSSLFLVCFFSLFFAPKNVYLSKYGDMRLDIFKARDMNAFLVWNNLKSSPQIYGRPGLF